MKKGISILKLINGETIMGNITDIHKGFLTVKRPVKFVQAQKGHKVQIGMVPALFFDLDWNDPSNFIIINSDCVMVEYPVTPNSEADYNNCTGTKGIIMPGAKAPGA